MWKTRDGVKGGSNGLKLLNAFDAHEHVGFT